MLKSEEFFEEIISGILENGYAIKDDFLLNEEVGHLKNIFEKKYNDGEFKQAGIGKSGDLKTQLEIRGDEILWIDEKTEEPAELLLLKKTNEFIQYLNATCYLGIKSVEIHYAKYENGKFYKRHKDMFQSQKGRILSIIFYLNTDWKPEHGGELVIYKERGGVEEAIKIEPIAGRMVCFESENLEHEVLPSYAPRLSITGWLKNVD